MSIKPSNVFGSTNKPRIFDSIDSKCNLFNNIDFDGEILYHGSTVKVEPPKVIEGRFTKDFGYGFYVTLISDQADSWSSRFSNGIVSKYIFNSNFHNLSYIKFDRDDEWLDFIVDCRLGKSHKYDIVEGPMADNQIYNYVNDFIRGDISRAAFWELAKFKHPTHQIAFCSSKSIECLKFIGSYEVKFNDKKRKR